MAVRKCNSVSGSGVASPRSLSRRTSACCLGVFADKCWDRGSALGRKLFDRSCFRCNVLRARVVSETWPYTALCAGCVFRQWACRPTRLRIRTPSVPELWRASAPDLGGKASCGPSPLHGWVVASTFQIVFFAGPNSWPFSGPYFGQATAKRLVKTNTVSDRLRSPNFRS